MLTVEENGWYFNAIQIYSALNILPVEIDMKSGKIQKTSSKTRIFLWSTLFSFAIFHWIYMFLRLVQSTILEPEKYFRWDHFILHLPYLITDSLLFLTGFCLFQKNPEEVVMVFNQLFVQRENPVQKMVDQEKQERERKLEIKSKWKRRTKVADSTSSSILSTAQNKNQDASKKISKDSESKSESGTGIKSKVRPLLAWPPQYSLDEILARTFPLTILPSKLFIMLIFASGPNRPQLLYSILPPKFQNRYSFFGFLTVEAIFLMSTFGFWLFSICCQLLFFGKCQLEFKQLNFQLRNLKYKFQSRINKNRDMRKEIWILRQISTEMRELVLFIELFNRCFPFCIFAIKLICMLISILFYFFTVRYFQEYPLFALFTAYCAISLTLYYGILYEKAFCIPEKMERLKLQFLLSAHKTASISKPKPTLQNANRSFRAEMTREIWGIRDVGVKVGSFHTLERASTPRFIDFVAKNVVNLLVTFPRKA